MAMTPMIVIGCGGSGGKVVSSLRQSLKVTLLNMGWNEGIPDAWQLLYVDTPGTQDVPAEYGGAVPAADYISVSDGQDSYRVIDGAVMAGAGTHLNRFVGWRPSPGIQLPVTNGAGQWRAVGRVAAFNGLAAVSARIETAMSKISGGGSQLARLGEKVALDGQPVESDPFVIVVSSLAGGTGAGIFLDIADVIRTSQPKLATRIAGVLFTAEVFKDLKNVPGVQPNTLAALCEMMNGYFNTGRAPEPLYQGNVTFRNELLSRSGINYPFVVGMTTLEGKQLDRISDSYRAVTETIAAALLNPSVATPLFNNQMTNWTNEQMNNVTSWDFGNANRTEGQSRVEAGVVSSFGSARLSVGVARFSEYAVHRLSRSIVEYLSDGYIQYGRALLNDPQASPEQIIDHLVTQHGLSFIEACGLRELNDPVEGEHNQLLDAVMPSEQLQSEWKSWVLAVLSEVQAVKPAATPAFWLQQIRAIVPTREKKFLHAVDERLDIAEYEVMATISQKLTEEVSKAIAQFGVPVASRLVKNLHEHVVASIKQLKEEAANERATGSTWSQQAGDAFVNIPAGTNLPGTHDVLATAVRRAGGNAFREACARSRGMTSSIMQRLVDQVLVRLIKMLDQVQNELAGDAAKAKVSGWPGVKGVPELLMPPPLEFCLVTPDRWPGLFQELLTATTGNEKNQRGTSDEVARRLVGGGAFEFQRDGVTDKARPALRLNEPWTGGPVEFTTMLEVDNIVERARLWLTRSGSVFGDFLAQKLGGYLSGTQNGQPVADLAQRIDRFRDGLAKTLQASTPLVNIDQSVLRKIHPASTMGNGTMTDLIAEKLPLPGGKAREVAEQILTPYLGKGKTWDDFFTGNNLDVEGVLYVTRLAGAVHPSVVTSLVAPIANSWNGTKLRQNSILPFWENRRARLLHEFVPLAPSALTAMIRGWFVGRLLGLISEPTKLSGFEIGHLDDTDKPRRARFPWPLLRSGVQANLADETLKMEWLPALLESLGLAFALVPSEPDIVNGYDAMYRLGEAQSIALTTWVKTGVTPAAITEPQVSGDTLEDRKEMVLEALREMSKPYDEARKSPIVADSQVFFAIPYGFDLYEEILDALADLTKLVSGMRGSGEGGKGTFG